MFNDQFEGVQFINNLKMSIINNTPETYTLTHNMRDEGLRKPRTMLKNQQQKLLNKTNLSLLAYRAAPK